MLAAASFGIYCTGQAFENRPDYTLDGTLMTVNFASSNDFSDYVRRAFRVVVSRLVAFTVDSVAPNSVTCRALFNHTPILEVIATITDPSGDEDDVNIFTIRPSRNRTINV